MGGFNGYPNATGEFQLSSGTMVAACGPLPETRCQRVAASGHVPGGEAVARRFTSAVLATEPGTQRMQDMLSKGTGCKSADTALPQTNGRVLEPAVTAVFAGVLMGIAATGCSRADFTEVGRIPAFGDRADLVHRLECFACQEREAVAFLSVGGILGVCEWREGRVLWLREPSRDFRTDGFSVSQDGREIVALEVAGASEGSGPPSDPAIPVRSKLVILGALTGGVLRAFDGPRVYRRHTGIVWLPGAATVVVIGESHLCALDTTSGRLKWQSEYPALGPVEQISKGGVDRVIIRSAGGVTLVDANTGEHLVAGRGAVGDPFLSMSGGRLMAIWSEYDGPTTRKWLVEFPTNGGRPEKLFELPVNPFLASGELAPSVDRKWVAYAMDMPKCRHRVFVYDIAQRDRVQLAGTVKCGFTPFAVGFAPAGELVVGERNLIRVFRRRP